MNQFHNKYLHYTNGRFGISEKLFANMKYATKHISLKKLKEFKPYKNHNYGHQLPMLEKVNLLYVLNRLSEDIYVLNKITNASRILPVTLDFGYKILSRILYLLDYFDLNYSIEYIGKISYNMSEFIYSKNNIMSDISMLKRMGSTKLNMIKLNSLLNNEMMNHIYNESNFSQKNIAIYLFTMLVLLDSLINIDSIIDNRFITTPEEHLEWFMK